MKPKKLPQATIGRLCREVIGRASSIEAHAEFLARANDWVNDYINGVDYARVKRGGSEGSSVEMAALAAQTDDIAQNLTEFHRLLDQLVSLARKADKKREKIEADWSDELKKQAAEFIARRSATAAGSGDCVNCGRYVSGTANDRLRHSQCSACDVYERRTGNKRPKPLWGSDSTDGQCVAVKTSMGSDYRCDREVGHDGEHRFSMSEGAVA